MKNWQKATLVVGGACAVWSMGAAVASPFAGATDANVGVLSTCASGRWQLTFSVQSLYTQPMTVTLNDSHSAVTVTVPAEGSKTIKELPDDATFVYYWTSDEAHLHGDGVGAQNAVTLHKPGDCGSAPTTVPPTTSSTSCGRAIPPRTDCTPNITVEPAVPPLGPPATDPTTTVPVVESTVAQAPTVPPTDAPSVPTSSSVRAHAPTSAPIAVCRGVVTDGACVLASNGFSGTALALGAIVVVCVGLLLTILATRRRDAKIRKQRGES